MNTRETLKINEKGHLEIGGADVTKIAESFPTPLYIMDEDYIEKICNVYSQTLKEVYGDDGLISYASKAFCCKEIYRLISKFNLGADVVSSGELLTAKSAGFAADKLIFHGNNKSRRELELAVTSGVGYIVIDAISEIDLLSEIANKFGKKIKVLLRVNPGVEAHTHHYIQTAKVDSKFGFSISSGAALSAVKKVIGSNLILSGLHCHIGSQIFEIKSFLLAVEKMTEFYKELKEKLSLDLSVLDLGGGFGIWYNDEDKKFSINDYAKFIKSIAEKVKECVADKKIKKPYLILEPGRSIVGEAGITLYHAGFIKHIDGIKDYIAIDGGMFENPRFALYSAKYTVVAAENMNAIANKKYSIAGKCCESGDLIAEDVYLPEIKEGELIAVLSTGAYNYSMASNYNRNTVPGVVFVKGGNVRYVVKPQTDEDLLRNDI